MRISKRQRLPKNWTHQRLLTLHSTLSLRRCRVHYVLIAAALANVQMTRDALWLRNTDTAQLQCVRGAPADPPDSQSH
jgi:hypothetical protein